MWGSWDGEEDFSLGHPEFKDRHIKMETSVNQWAKIIGAIELWISARQGRHGSR